MAEGQDARVQEIRARIEAATPGPWQAWPDGPEESVESVSVGRFVCHMNSNMRQFREDAAFIAHAREDVPYLLNRLDALTAERDEWRARAVDHAMTIDAKNPRIEQVKRLYELTRAERDALAARLAAAEAALVLADEVSRLTTWGITVTDCREGCEHPACLILRAIAKYRKARASLAAASDSISDSGESSRLSE